MEDKLLTQKDLAEYWSVAEATLERWRCAGIGPRYLKLTGLVRYRISDVQAFEEESLRASTLDMRISGVGQHDSANKRRSR